MHQIPYLDRTLFEKKIAAGYNINTSRRARYSLSAVSARVVARQARIKENIPQSVPVPYLISFDYFRYTHIYKSRKDTVLINIFQSALTSTQHFFCEAYIPKNPSSQYVLI